MIENSRIFNDANLINKEVIAKTWIPIDLDTTKGPFTHRSELLALSVYDFGVVHCAIDPPINRLRWDWDRP